MGVLGLWQILESVGHPIKLDGLEGKRLGVDANVWLYKFIRGFREKDNATSIDSHKLGLFNRISKLLFYKIKPIFVFDGPAPVLKRRTLERRQNVRNKQLAKVQDAAMKLIAEQLKGQYPNANIDDLKIQLPELRSHSLVAAEKLTDEDRDLFYLPPEEKKLGSSEDSDSGSDQDIQLITKPQLKSESIVYHVDSDEDLMQSEVHAPVDIDSKDFEELPAEVRYEILTDIREKRRRIRRRHALPEDAGNFSSFQLQRLQAKRKIQEKIEKCEKDICSMYTGEMGSQTIKSYRVQSDSTSTMLYMQQTTPKIEINSQESGVATQNTDLSTSIYQPKAEDISKQSRVDKAKLRPLFETASQPASLVGTINVRAGVKDSSIIGSERISMNSPSFSEPSSYESDFEQQVEETEQSQQESIGTQRSDSTVIDDKSSNHTTEISSQETETENHKFVECPQEIPSPLPPKVMDETDSELEEVPLPTEQSPISLVESQIELTDSPVVTPSRHHATITIDSSPAQTPSPQHTILIDTSQADTPEQPSSRKQVFEEKLEPPPSKTVREETVEKLIEEKQVTIEESIVPKTDRKEEEPKVSTSAPKEREKIIMNDPNLEKLRDIRSESTRTTNKVTTKIVEEAKELLRLFGIPYIDAAGEAEAQCALLEKMKLTEGTITDDSDVWLFGAQHVYRYFFSDDKYVMQYKMTEIEHHIRMNRENLVCFAMLVGSDYTDGIMNVGPVTALEILSEFPGDGLDPLIKFKNWMDKYKRSKDRVPGSKKRESFLKFKLPEEFPSRAVFEGYLRPMADLSTEEFSWGTPELDELREYARRNFGWEMKKIDEKLLPVMKKLSERRTQMTIDSYFFKTAANQNPELFRSKRVNEALNKISKTTVSDDNEVILTEDEDDDSPKAGGSNNKKRPEVNKRATKQNDLKNQRKKKQSARGTSTVAYKKRRSAR